MSLSWKLPTNEDMSSHQAALPLLCPGGLIEDEHETKDCPSNGHVVLAASVDDEPSPRNVVSQEESQSAAEEAVTTPPLRRSNRDVDVSLVCGVPCESVILVPPPPPLLPLGWTFAKSHSSTINVLLDGVATTTSTHFVPSRLVSLLGFLSVRIAQSIRLSGTACTFYRRLRDLFFSNPTHKRDYEGLILNGCSKRRPRGHDADGGRGACKPERAAAVRVRRESRCRDAPIYVIDNFLTESELDYFDKAIASARFERSFVDNMSYDDDDDDDDDGADGQGGTGEGDDDRTGASIGIDDSRHKNIDTGKGCGKKRKKRTLLDDSHRTSTFFSFRKLHDTKICGLEQRVANLMGCWVHQVEALQLVRYGPGQFFGVHHDMGDLMEDDQVRLPRKNLAVKRRLVTIFCYLNTLEKGAGGDTYFPMCKLRVQPQRGRAVLWSNVTSDGQADPRTIHAGEPVKTILEGSASKSDGRKRIKKEGGNDGSGEAMKYGLNIWICEE